MRNKTELNAKHKFEVINTLAIPIVTYTFNVINWNLEKIQRIDRIIKELFTKYNIPHPIEADQLYVPWTDGGR